MGQPTPPLPTGGGAARATQVPNLPNMQMDPTTQANILAQIQRSGWNASQPTPEIQFTQDPGGNPTPVVKGWSMVITDPKTGTNEKVGLSYSPGGRMPWGITDAPKSLPTDPAVAGRTTVKTNQGVYSYDPKTQTTTYLMPSDIPNADEEISKAVERQDREALRNEKEANYQAGRGYQTDADYHKMADDAARTGISAGQLAENIRQFNADQAEKIRQFDIKQAAQDKKDAQDILQSKATVGQINAQTGQITTSTSKTQQEIEQSAELFPLTKEQTQATTAGIKARTAAEEQAQKIAAAPTLQGGLTTPYLTTVNPLTGQVDQSQMNKAYLPKTQGEIAARVGQIQSLAQAKGQEIQAKVGQNGYTADQALADYNKWWDQNVAPQTQALQSAQEENAFTRAKDAAQARQQGYQTALGAGTQAINAFNAEAANRVGPNYENVINQIRSGKDIKNIDMTGAFTYKGPSVQDTANQAVQNSLKTMGADALPQFQGVDIPGLLNRTQYMPGAMPPQGPPGQPMPSQGPPPGPPQPMPSQGPPPPPMVSSGTQGPGNPWANGTPPPGTTWQNANLPNPFDYLKYQLTDRYGGA